MTSLSIVPRMTVDEMKNVLRSLEIGWTTMHKCFSLVTGFFQPSMAKDLHFSFRKTKEYLVDLVHDSRNVSQVQLGVSHGNVQVDALFHDDDPTRSLQYIQVACIQPFHQKLNITPRIVVSLEQT